MSRLAGPTVEDQPYRLRRRRWRTPVVAELALHPEGEPLPFVPGQYVLVGDQDYRVPVRSYSMANAPDRTGLITLLVTEVPDGETSGWLARGVHVGDTVLVSGPYGSFVPRAGPDVPTLCLAGGSGVAPIRAIAQQAVARGPSQPFLLLFSGRTEADVIDRDLFTGWQRDHPGFRYVRTLTRSDGPEPLGRVQDVLPALLSDLSGHEVFVAGAPSFVRAGARAARDLGARPGLLHTEEFFAEPRPWATPTQNQTQNQTQTQTQTQTGTGS